MMMMSPIANNNNTTMNATTMMVVGGVDRDDSTGSLNAAPSPVTTSTSVIAATAAAVVSAFPDFGSYDVPITARGSLLHKSASLSANSDTDADPYADIIASSPTDADDDDDDHGITDSEHDDPHRRTTASTRDSSLRSPPSTYQTSRVSSSSSSSSSTATPTPVSAPTTSPSIPPIVVQSASTPHLTGTLTVRVIGARKLYSHSPKHFMSPFCMVSLPPFLSSTSSHDRGDTQPHWDQQFVLQVQDCPVEEMFVCSVWDEKRKDDGLALLDIEIGKLMNPLYLGRHWFPLRHPVHADMVAGELELDVQWKGTAYEWPNLSPNPADFRVRVHKFAMASVSDVFAGEREAANNKKGDVTSNDNNTAAPVRSRDFRASDTLHPNQLRAGADAGAGAGSAAPHTADSSSTTTTTANKHLVDNRTGLTLIHEETVPDLYNNKLALSRPDGSMPPLLHSATSFGIATMGPCGPGVAHVALPDQTFTLHDDRHLSSFLPPDTSLLTAAYGADHSIAVHSSPRYGLIYDDTTHFDDRNFLQHQAPSARIVEVRVWSREYIHGLQIVYKVGHEYRHTPRYMGKVHTTMHRFVLSDCGDEEIIAIRGTYKEWLETLTIVTNKRWKTFGGNVENRPKRWLPPGSEQAPVKFDLSLPAGHRVLGFFGGYGVHLHNLGVSYVPIVQQNSSRFGKCIVNVLKHKLARIGSVEFDAVSHEEGGGDHSPGVVSKQGSNGSGSKGVSTTVSGSGSGSSTSKSR